MKLELVRELRDQGDHAGVVRARRKLGEDPLLAADEEFDAEDSLPAQRLDDLARLAPGREQGAFGECGRLPALAVIAGFLAVADGRAEDDAVLGRDSQKRDLAVERDELLDDDARTVAAHVGDRMIPGIPDILARASDALAFAGTRHDGLDYAGQA